MCKINSTHSSVFFIGFVSLFLIFAGCNGPFYPFWSGPDSGEEEVPAADAKPVMIHEIEVTHPKQGITPAANIKGTTQFTGKVTWYEKRNLEVPINGSFQERTIYVAKIRLTVVKGYTFAGLPPTHFYVKDVAAAAEFKVDAANKGIGVVTVEFPKTHSANAVVYNVTADTEHETLEDALDKVPHNSAATIHVLKSFTTPNRDSYLIDGNKNITLQSAVDAPEEGYTITAAPGGFSLFTVYSGASLTLGTATNSKRLILSGGGLVAQQRRGVLVNGELVMYQEVIIEDFINDGDHDGGGVFVPGGTFTMKGGTIRANQASSGGGVFVMSGGTFIMEDGIIYGSSENSNSNIATDNASSPGEKEGASLFVFGGTATYGLGGVNILPAGKNYTNDTLPVIAGPGGNEVMIGSQYYPTLRAAIESAPATGTSVDDPTIIEVVKNDIIAIGTHSIATGQHIRLQSPAGSTRTITAAAGGFPLFIVNSGASLTLGGNGGYISLSGGTVGKTNFRQGVRINNTGTLIMKPGSVIRNFRNGDTSDYEGGGVYIGGYGKFSMEGGIISGNNAGRGGGVYVNVGRFFMSAGTIDGNTAGVENASLHVEGGGQAFYGTEALPGDEIANTDDPVYGL